MQEVRSQFAAGAVLPGRKERWRAALDLQAMLPGGRSGTVCQLQLHKEGGEKL